MYVHIGGECTLSDRLIVGVFDMENITRKQKNMIRFLSDLEKKDGVEYVSEEVPKSIILTVEKVFFSPVSAQVLLKRMDHTA